MSEPSCIEPARTDQSRHSALLQDAAVRNVIAAIRASRGISSAKTPFCGHSGPSTLSGFAVFSPLGEGASCGCRHPVKPAPFSEYLVAKMNPLCRMMVVAVSQPAASTVLKFSLLRCTTELSIQLRETTVFKLVCLLNSTMVLPFAASVLIAPDFTFGQFGLGLGPEGAGVARGYGAAALGWGLVCVLLRNSTDAGVVRTVLIASLAFNGGEVLIQVPIALSGIAAAMIWVTIGGHFVAALLSALGLMNRNMTAL